MKHIELFKNGFDSTVSDKIRPENWPYIAHDIVSGEIVYTLVPEPQPDNEIWYTSSNEYVVTPYSTSVFGADIVSNTYEDGKGVIKFDNSVTSIGDKAFYNSSQLTSITIPNRVTSIGNNAFRNCSSLPSIMIPNSVTSIGNDAFYGCFSLTKTNYTGDITGWCNIEFAGSYANPMCYSGNFYINDQEIKDLVIPESVTSIGNYTFAYCSSLTSVIIPNSVTNIGIVAFGSCESLTSITIPNSVTSIGYWGFGSCKSITSVTIGNGITSIGDWAFGGCTSLATIICKATTPPSLGSSNNLSNVTAVYVPVESVDAYKTSTNWWYYTSKIQPIL